MGTMSASGKTWSLIQRKWEWQSNGDKVRALIEGPHILAVECPSCLAFRCPEGSWVGERHRKGPPVLCMTGRQACEGHLALPAPHPLPKPRHVCPHPTFPPATWPLSQGHWQEGGTAWGQMSLAGSQLSGDQGGSGRQRDRKPPGPSCSFSCPTHQ